MKSNDEIAESIYIATGVIAIVAVGLAFLWSVGLVVYWIGLRI